MYTIEDVKSRLDNINSVLAVNYTNEVGKRIKEYTVSYRQSGETILGRVDLYFPLFEREIQKRNLPEELKYIAVVESHLDPMAKSKSGAIGLWQFMRATGRMKGLKIDNYLDERKDPEKSTAAALEYLSDLYNRFGDWTLAVAAYNCGPGNVRKAIRRGNSKDYWEIRHHLPRETQKYVPRIIAAMYLMRYYHYHDLSPRNVETDLMYTREVNDGKAHNFYTLAKDLEMDFNTLKQLNPQFQTQYFPKNTGHLTLIIPDSKYELYLEKYDPEVYNAIVKRRRQDALRQKIKEQLMLQKSREVTPVEPLDLIEPSFLVLND